jgi:hypothetical protein
MSKKLGNRRVVQETCIPTTGDEPFMEIMSLKDTRHPIYSQMRHEQKDRIMRGYVTECVEKKLKELEIHPADQERAFAQQLQLKLSSHRRNESTHIPQSPALESDNVSGSSAEKDQAPAS